MSSIATELGVAGFVRGTRLLTPNGYVPVEIFKPGDPIIARLGIRRAVRRAGRRDVEIRCPEDWPVIVLPGAMGVGIPSRPVRLSPLHAVFVDHALVPAMHLVNGVTIRREQRATVSYFQIDLDRHDVLLSEGLLVENATNAAYAVQTSQ